MDLVNLLHFPLAENFENHFKSFVILFTFEKTHEFRHDFHLEIQIISWAKLFVLFCFKTKKIDTSSKRRIFLEKNVKQNQE